MKQSDGVANETVDVTNRLGGHVGCWLVVGRLDGRKFTLQQRVDCTVLAWDDLQTLHSLATSESKEKMSQQLVVGNEFHGGWDPWRVYSCLPIEDGTVLCTKRNKSVCTSMSKVYTCMYEYVLKQ